MSYQISQPDGAGDALVGRAMNGAWLDAPITVTGTAGGTGSLWAHTMLYRPDGSSALFVNANQRAATFTPDVIGTYRIRLVETINGVAQPRIQKVIRVTKNAAGVYQGIVSIAPEESISEADYDGNEAGFVERMQANDATIRAELGAAGAAVTALDARVDALEAGGGEVVAYTGLVSLAASTSTIYDQTGQPGSLGLAAASGFTAQAEFECLIPAGTAPSFEFADELDPNAKFDVFVPGADYYVVATALSATQFVAAGVSLPIIDTVAAVVGDPYVDGGDLDVLFVPFDKRSHCPLRSVAGLSLTGTMAIARTITGIFSGNGTEEIGLQLSGNLDLADTPSLVIASNAVLRGMNGPKVAAGSHAIEIIPADYDVTLETNETLWHRADSLSALGNGDPIDGWTGRNPPAAAAFVATAGNRPTFVASDASNGKPAVLFDGVDDRLQASAFTMGDAIGTGDYCVVAAVRINAIPAGSLDFNNPAILADQSGYWCMSLTQNGGNYHLVCLHFGALVQYATHSFGASLPSRAIVSMRKSGTAIRAGIKLPGGAFAEGVAINDSGLNAGAQSLLLVLGRSIPNSKTFSGSIFEHFFKKDGTLPAAAIAAYDAKYQQ